MRSAEQIDGLNEDKTAVAGVTHRSGISISTAVLIGVLFLIMAAATPFVLSLTVATRNTNELIADKAELAIGAIRSAVRSHIDPARAQIDHILKPVEDGAIDPRDESRFVRFLQATMAAAPQVAFVGIVRPDYTHTSAMSFGPDPIVRGTLGDDPVVREQIDESATADGPFWGEPFYESDAQTSFLNLRAPVYRDGEYLGVLLTGISVKDLSDFLANLDLGEDTSTPFVLYGRNHVMAHEALVFGVYFDLAEVGVQYRRLWMALAGGCILVLIALVIGLLAGKRLSRYSRRLVAVAGHIRELDIEHAPALPASRIRELNESAEAFNSMVRALRWFEMYVPRKLVRRLIQSGQTRALSSENRTLTVLFTDVSGFTQLAAAMPAEAVADFLNRHFGLIAECVETEGGTVDKYIGDGVMAFWGAPEDQPDHATRAARAALDVVARVSADNAEWQAAGQPPVRLRIGIHSGPVVVGNIGAPGRVNYTIIGATVNTAQRLEQLGKEFGGEAAAIVLTSAETVAMMGPGFDVEALGTKVLRGRAEETRIYRLKGRTGSDGTA